MSELQDRLRADNNYWSRVFAWNMPVQQFTMMPDDDPDRRLTYYFDAIGELDPVYFLCRGILYDKSKRMYK